MGQLQHSPCALVTFHRSLCLTTWLLTELPVGALGSSGAAHSVGQQGGACLPAPWSPLIPHSPLGTAAEGPGPSTWPCRGSTASPVAGAAPGGPSKPALGLFVTFSCLMFHLPSGPPEPCSCHHGLMGSPWGRPSAGFCWCPLPFIESAVFSKGC